jgi:hypothetical protein
MIKVLIATWFLFLTIPQVICAEDVAVPTTVIPAAAQSSVPYIPRPVVQTSSQPKSAESALLEKKLAELDRLQKEVDDLRAVTRTPAMVHVRIQAIEVNLTCCERAGIDISALRQSQIVDAKNSPGDVDVPPRTNGRNLNVLTNSLEQNGFAKVLADPELMVTCGRPATFNVGGELPVRTPDGNGVEHRPFGTQVDLLAESLGNNKVRLHVRPRISEIDTAQQIVVKGVKVPGVSVRQCDVTTELALGQSVILSGLTETRVKVARTDGENLEKREQVELVFVIAADEVGDPPTRHPHTPVLHKIGDHLFAPPTQ